VEISRGTYYAERSFESAARLAAAEGADEARLRLWLDSVRRGGSGLKERDAEALLCHMREFLETRPGPFHATFTLERTEFLERFRNEVELSRVTRLDRPPTDEHEVLRGGETMAELRGKQLLRILARREAERLGWQLTVDEVEEKAELFRARHGLLAPEKMLGWMEAEGLSEAAFWQFINDDCLIDRLRRLYGHDIERGLADQLRFGTARLYAAREEQETAALPDQ
jgi:hypothetical protein